MSASADAFTAAANLLERRATEPLLDIASTVLEGYLPRPHTNYLSDRLTDAVRRVANGEQVRMIVSLPPGAGKSSIGSVALPLFALRQYPRWQIGIVCGESTLAQKFSRDVRRAITEERVNIALADRRAGAFTVGFWETAQKGSVTAKGLSGKVPGRRFKLLIIDDPIASLADAYSTRSRDAAWDHWQGTLKPRLRQDGALVVVISTRWHEDDLAGRLIDRQTDDAPWEEIRIPAIAELGDLLGREVGEPLLSPQVDETIEQALARWETTKTEVGGVVWDALYQQRPAPPGGVVFLRDWWQFYEEAEAPARDAGQMLTSWDLTFGAGASEVGDFAVGQVWQKVGADCYLRDQVRGRWPFTEQIRQIRALVARWPEANLHLVEKAAAGGPAVDTLQQEIPGLVAVPPGSNSKVVRAQAVAPTVESKNVYLPKRAEWIDTFLQEVSAFPYAPHDDQVDPLSQALKRMQTPEPTAQMHVLNDPEEVRASRGGGLSAALQGGY